MAKAVEIGVSFKVEKSDADKAEKNLKGRFDKIGKTFGNSLIAGTKSFLASSAAGAVAALVLLFFIFRFTFPFLGFTENLTSKGGRS